MNVAYRIGIIRGVDGDLIFSQFSIDCCQNTSASEALPGSHSDTHRYYGGCEFEPRPRHYSRMSFSSDQATGTVFPHLNMPFLPNSKFI